MDGLTRGMISGLLVALALIFAVLVVGLGSVRIAALAMIPNVTPLLFCGGILGWLNIPIAMGTSIVGCVAVGLAVDDTSHVLGHLNRERSIEHTYSIVGAPVVLTSVALGAGFSVMMLSGFQSISAFGIATAATLAVALAADLYLLPALLALAGYRVRAQPVQEMVATQAVGDTEGRTAA